MSEALAPRPAADPLTDPTLTDDDATTAPDAPAASAAPAAPAASTGNTPSGTAARAETVTCPECGTRATVALTRREAGDFCARCDFPLFWTPSTIQLGDRDTATDTLRRLPGTGGRVTVASAACPHCNEANPLSAVVCVRCGLPMVVEEAPPAPVPVAPPPAPQPPPEQRSLLWLWLVLGATAAVAVLLVWWFAAGRG